MGYGKYGFAVVALIFLFAVCAVRDDFTLAFLITAAISLLFLLAGIISFPHFRSAINLAIPNAAEDEPDIISLRLAGTEILLRPYVQVATCTLSPRHVPELAACGLLAMATMAVLISGLASYRVLLLGWGLFALEAACFAAAIVLLLSLRWADECQFLKRAHCALAAITGVQSGLGHQQLTYEFADTEANRFGGYTRIFAAHSDNVVVVFYHPRNPDENRAHPSLNFHRVRVRSVEALKLPIGLPREKVPS